MARLVTSGAEITAGAGVLTSPDGSIGGAVTRDTGTFRSGLASFKCAGTSGTTPSKFYQWTAPATGQTVFARIYIDVDAFPTNTVTIMNFVTGGTLLVGVKMTSGGLLQLWNLTGTPAQIGSSSSAISAGTWYRVELSVLINTGATDAAEFQLDGTSVASTSGISLTTDTPPQELDLGWTQNPGSTCNMFIDDVAVNDSTGASQTTWPGDGNVVMLFPTADSAVAAGWTDSGGSATNLFQSVDNTPPTGIADTTSNAGHQIRDATTGANEAYDATMTDYTAAGVPSGATVNVVDPVISTAAPVSTSAKVGQVGVVSNPAIAVINLTANSGQFWSGSAAGTYESGWKWSHGTVTYAPSVTLGTAPVMRVTQVTSSTRIAMVCFMGIYVDYTPAVVEVIPYLVAARR